MKIFSWKSYHRWVGLLISVFMLVFCFSGIILNHRTAWRDCEVSRAWMPSSYHIKNFNNGVVKGTLNVGSLAEGRLSASDSVLAFGGAGVWLTDRQAKTWTDFNAGMPEGADNRNIRNIVQTRDGKLWCAAQYELFCHNGERWETVALPDNDERLTDVALNKDSSAVVVLTRSKVYRQSADGGLQGQAIASPIGYEPKLTLFKTVWQLHSGEYFGMVGRLVVDAVAVVLILLSLTGIVLFILPYSMRKQKRRGNITSMKSTGKRFVWNQKWHKRIGYYTIALTLWLSITGMCLRPPLMIPLALTKMKQSVKAGNVWHDKLRGLRWDEANRLWMVSTSEGFMTVDEDFAQAPVLIDKAKAPGISPMGITVFERERDEWIIGSFSGIYRWNPQTGKVADYYTGKAEKKQTMRPVSNSLVSGYSTDLLDGQPIVFDYAKGTSAALEMPEQLAETKMSLWNVALELHVGRCYTPFLGPISDLFVFISGLLITLTLVSGLILMRRRR